jgi:hypothetical protein
MNAFLYLTWTSARNRFGHQLKRVRRPRYAAALIVGIAYVWAFLVRPVGHPAVATALVGQPTEMMVSLLLAVTLLGAWVFGSDLTPLAFTQAEVSMLFPAPLSRRALIGFKLYRAQIAVVVNTIIWVFILRRGGTELPSLERAIGIWVLFSTLNLHRLGAALVRASWREHGRAGARKHVWSLLAFAVVFACIIGGIVQHWSSLVLVSGIGEFFVALGQVLASAPASIGLTPFHLIVAPTFAHSTAGWMRTLLPAAGVLALHAAWVFHTDRAFEDAALAASAERARRVEASRSRRSAARVGAPRAATSSLRLAAVGHPVLAIIWKNLLCLRRTAQYRVFIGPVVIAVALGAALADGRGDPALIVAASALTLAGMLLVFGGRLIRNDLRHDMLNLPLLKSLPLAGGDVVLAEVASAALPMAAVQWLLIVAAFIASFVSTSAPLTVDLRIALLVASPFAVLALNGALLTIQNGTVVMFPAWIRLGATVHSGVEALGQNLLATTANLISLGAALAVPLLASYAIVLLLKQPKAAAIGLLVIFASVLLAAETYAAMRLLGGALGRVEPPAA